MSVKYVRIELLDPDTIHATSVCEVTRSDLNTDSLKQRQNGVYDNRLGCLGYFENCQTCCSDINDCPGHFGHIDLPLPCYHPFFLNQVYSIVRECCVHCCSWNGSNEKECGFCNKRIGKWSRSGQHKDQFVHSFRHHKTFITANEVMKMLKSFDEQHPAQRQPRRWLLTTALPVIPIVARPLVRSRDMQSHNPLSQTYSNIVKEVKLLTMFLKQNRSKHIIDQQHTRLQNVVYKIYDVKNQNETKYLEGIRQRLDSKQGRFRKHLLGKRCDFSARTVSKKKTVIVLNKLVLTCFFL